MHFNQRILFTLINVFLVVLIIILLFQDNSKSPYIYAVTPTYDHVTQKSELVRLWGLLQNVDNLKWIVIEDKESRSDWIADFLSETGLSYVHLHAHTPDSLRAPEGEPKWKYPRGIEQRNKALTWLRSHRVHDGVVYFMDDDNTYHPEVFEEMRYTKRVSIWPVGFAGDALVESPVVESGKVTGFIGGFGRHRKFPVDMSGFAINLKYILHSEVVFVRYSSVGQQETKLLENFGFELEDLEPKGNQCTKVLAWHTKTQIPNISQEVDWRGDRV